MIGTNNTGGTNNAGTATAAEIAEGRAKLEQFVRVTQQPLIDLRAWIGAGA